MRGQDKSSDQFRTSSPKIWNFANLIPPPPPIDFAAAFVAVQVGRTQEPQAVFNSVNNRAEVAAKETIDL